MLNVDHSNIDDPSLAVKCVRKFGSPLGEEVIYTGCFKRNVTSNCKFDGKITNIDNWMQ